MGTLIVGNWKMNGVLADLKEAGAVAEEMKAHGLGGVTAVICPPFTLVGAMAAQVASTALYVGGQDCHGAHKGAFTGDVSATMLRDLGASHVIVGHSERRQDHCETDAIVKAKAEAAVSAGLVPIICVGESQAQRALGAHIDVVMSQLEGSLPELASQSQICVAYEPIWAIGTGLVPQNADISDMHRAIYEVLRQRYGGTNADTCPVLYGGSVNPGNAGDILRLPHVDGALVGGASLKAESFLSIVHAGADAAKAR